MGIEIERKFLVDNALLPTLTNGYQIKQGYIKTLDHSTVRVRIRNQEAFLTIKGKSTGISRLEFEYPIPLEDANTMLNNLCQTSIIEKIRHPVKYKGHLWEIDIFHGQNRGLVVAEIELKSKNEMFVLPPWIKKEVSEDKRYANSNLIKVPYLEW